jgi:hypothetical protein
MSAYERKYRQGYWMSVGIYLGVAMGVAFSLVFDNFGVGIGIGVAIGAGIGTSLEKRNKHHLHPLSAEEMIRQKRGVNMVLALVGLLAVIFSLVYLFQAT